MKHATGRSRRRNGFTLLELIIVMALISMLAGVILPTSGAILRSKGRRATIEEMGLIAAASQEFYRDTRQFPSDPLDLLGSGTAGWSGPYLPGVVDDPWSGQAGYAVDGFGTDYVFAASGVQMTITSLGADRTSGTADDIQLDVNVTALLRQMTMDELRVINVAITQYNALHLAINPLPGDFAVALSVLEGASFLPIGSDYGTDEWGDAYTGDPPAVSPMTAAISVNISGGP